MKKAVLVITAILLVSLLIFLKETKNAGIFKRFSFSISYKNNNSNVSILIDINEKRLYAVSNDRILAKFPIASGKPDTPSPLGDFSIIQKSRWGEGFGSAWLGLDVPWGTYGIHGTTSPGSIGRAASHGCIRMKNKDIDKLYKLVHEGTPVKIVGGNYGLLGNGYRELVPGDRGGDVMLVQNKLMELGFYGGIVDGIYGTGMEKALNAFQKSKKLPITNHINEKLYREMGIVLME